MTAQLLDRLRKGEAVDAGYSFRFMDEPSPPRARPEKSSTNRFERLIGKARRTSKVRTSARFADIPDHVATISSEDLRTVLVERWSSEMGLASSVTIRGLKIDGNLDLRRLTAGSLDLIDCWVDGDILAEASTLDRLSLTRTIVKRLDVTDARITSIKLDRAGIETAVEAARLNLLGHLDFIAIEPAPGSAPSINLADAIVTGSAALTTKMSKPAMMLDKIGGLFELNADRAKFSSNLSLSHGFFSRINLEDCSIEGSFFADGLFILEKISLRRSEIKGILFSNDLKGLQDKFNIYLDELRVGGTVNLISTGGIENRAKISGINLFTLGNLTIFNGYLHGINLKNSIINGSFDLRSTYSSMIDISDAVINGILDLQRASASNILCARSHISGAVRAIYLGSEKGPLNFQLDGARLDGDLLLHDNDAPEDQGLIISGIGIVIGGRISIKDRKISEAEFHIARISGSFVLSGVKLIKISLYESHIGGELIFNEIIVDTEEGICNLNSIEVRGICFFKESNIKCSLELIDARLNSGLFCENLTIETESIDSCLNISRSEISGPIQLLHSRFKGMLAGSCIDASELSAKSLWLSNHDIGGMVDLQNARFIFGITIGGGRIEADRISLNLTGTVLGGDLLFLPIDIQEPAEGSVSKDKRSDTSNASLFGTLLMDRTNIGGALVPLALEATAPHDGPAIYAHGAKIGAVRIEYRPGSATSASSDAMPNVESNAQVFVRPESVVTSDPAETSSPDQAEIGIEDVQLSVRSGPHQASASVKPLVKTVAPLDGARPDKVEKVADSGPEDRVDQILPSEPPSTVRKDASLRTKGPIAFIGCEIDNQLELEGLDVSAWFGTNRWGGTAILLRDTTVRTRMNIGGIPDASLKKRSDGPDVDDIRNEIHGQIAIIDSEIIGRVTFSNLRGLAPTQCTADVGEGSRFIYMRNCRCEADVVFYDLERTGHASRKSQGECDIFGQVDLLHCRIQGDIELGRTAIRPLAQSLEASEQDSTPIKTICTSLCYAHGVPSQSTMMSLYNTKIEGDLILSSAATSDDRIGTLNLSGFSARTVRGTDLVPESETFGKPSDPATLLGGEPSYTHRPAHQACGQSGCQARSDEDGPLLKSGVSLLLDGANFERFDNPFDELLWLRRSNHPSLSSDGTFFPPDTEPYERAAILLRAAGRPEQARAVIREAERLKSKNARMILTQGLRRFRALGQGDQGYVPAKDEVDLPVKSWLILRHSTKRTRDALRSGLRSLWDLMEQKAHQIFGFCFGYGYSSRRALGTLLSLLALGTVGTMSAQHYDLLVSKSDKPSVAVCKQQNALLFAADAMLLGIDVGPQARCDYVQSLPANVEGRNDEFINARRWNRLASAILDGYGLISALALLFASLTFSGIFRRDK